MKTILTLILLCCLTAQAQFSPVKDPRGFVGGYFKGSNLQLTNATFYTGAGVGFGSIDQYAGLTFSDTNGNAKMIFDGFVSTFSLLDKVGTPKVTVDENNKLFLGNPIITGIITGNGGGLTNLPGGAGSGIATNGGSGINNLFTNASMKNIALYDITGSVYNQFTTYNTAVFSLGVLAITNGQLSYFGGSGLLSVKLDTTNVLASAGSSLNQVGITNGNVTIPGNLSVADTLNLNTLNVTNFIITNPWDGSLATNVSATSIKRSTNFVADVTLIDLTKMFAYTNHTANFTITGFTPGTYDTSGTNAMVITRMFTNNSVGAKTITMPSGWIDIGNVGNPVYNTNIGQLGIIVVPNFITNYIWSGK